MNLNKHVSLACAAHAEVESFVECDVQTPETELECSAVQLQTNCIHLPQTAAGCGNVI